MFNSADLVCLQLRAPEWMEGDDFNTQAVMNICGEWDFSQINRKNSSTFSRFISVFIILAYCSCFTLLNLILNQCFLCIKYVVNIFFSLILAGF